MALSGVCSRYVSTRYVLAYLGFTGFAIVYMLRVSLSIAILAMVKDDGSSQTNNQAECPPVDGLLNHSQSHGKGPKYDWDANLQGHILSSFFYGYMITQTPGGWLAGKYGGKMIFGLGVLCSSILALLTPLAAEWSVYVVIFVRALEGFGEGVTFPAMHAIWAEWAPPSEKSELVSLTYSGVQFGTVVGLLLSGVIIEQLGWVWVFYAFGTFGCIWFILWMVMASDSPSSHKRIKLEEKMQILSEIAKNKSSTDPVTFWNTPWLMMISSPAFWAVAVVHFVHAWGFYTLLTSLPLFLKNVLQFNIAKCSLASALPNIFMWAAIWVSGYTVDTLRERKILSTVAARKIVLAIGLLVCAGCLVGVGFVGCNYTAAVVLLCIAGTFDGIAQSSYYVNHIDIAPKYAGTLMGMTNTLATISGILSPEVVGWLTSQNSTSQSWRSVFYVTAELHVFGVIIFAILGKGEVQPWAMGTQGYSTVLNQDHYTLMDRRSENTENESRD